MSRTRVILVLVVLLTCAFGALAQAAAPHAQPYPGISVAPNVPANALKMAPQGTAGAAGFFIDPIEAALAIGNRLVDVQADVTNDNAGNGADPGDSDADDGGWDWEITGATQHPAGASYENLYGPIARGLTEAAIFTGNARLGIGAGDVFAGISKDASGLYGTPLFRIWDGDIATAYVRWAGRTGNTALKDTIKARHDQELIVRGGAGGRARTVCLGRRGQGLAGMWPWDIQLLSNDSKALALAFPGSAAAYEAEVDSVSQVLMDDMNGLLGAGGWNPSSFAQNYHQHGITGALRVFDASQRTDDNALATAMRDTLVNGQLADGSWGISYGGGFFGQDLQATAYAVLALTEYAKRHNDAAAMHAASHGQQWLLGFVQADGVVDDGFGEYAETSAEVAQALLTGDDVTPVAPATCTTPAYACVAVPVAFNRTDPTPVRGYSLTLTLSSNLTLCGAGIVQGGYLNGIGGTNYQVLNPSPGVYTVDCAILGGNSGATGSGTLFTLNLAGAVSGTGTVTVNSVIVRDLDNAPVSAIPGAAATITIDNTAPVAIAGLAAAQVKSGNGTDGRTSITVSWPAVESGATVQVYRAPFGNYPEYDDAGGVVPSYPSVGTWTLAGEVTSGTTLADRPAARDFWYYVAFVKDACGNVGPVSNQTGGTLNYHLGDVHDGSADCAGNNLVSTEDISFLGAHYGAAVQAGFNCLDVGPTTNYSVNARPTTDNKVNFEDLMMFAINHGLVSAPQSALLPVAAASDELWLEGPAKVTAGGTFTVSLRLKGAGDLQGLSAQLGWDRGIAEPVSVEAGGLATTQNAVVFSSGAGNVDAALLGANRGFVGEGVLATVTFRALANGAPGVTLAKLDARNLGNQPVALAGMKPPTVTATWFAPAMPNPFRGTTTLSYALAQGGVVELTVYGVDGRKVATLASGVQEAGSYRLNWDGAGARPGLYYARLTTPQGRFTRTLVLTK